MLRERSARYAAVALVGCVTAAVLLVAFDFAGWLTIDVSSQTRFRYSADPVDIFRTRVDREVTSQVRYYGASINLFSPYGVVIAPVVALLLYGAYVSFRGLRSGVAAVPLGSLRRAFYASVIASAVLLVGGGVFELVMQVSDPEDWWHDAGFYGGVSGGATAAVFLQMTIRLARPAR